MVGLRTETPVIRKIIYQEKIVFCTLFLEQCNLLEQKLDENKSNSKEEEVYSVCIVTPNQKQQDLDSNCLFTSPSLQARAKSDGWEKQIFDEFARLILFLKSDADTSFKEFMLKKGGSMYMP